jgi:hypothetical protein
VCRDCFLLRKIEGLSHPQIAERWAFPAAWWKAHRQCHEALPGAHAAVGILNAVKGR